MLSRSESDVFLKFMEATIKRVTSVMATNYAIQKILIQKGTVTKDELLFEIKEANQHPTIIRGKKALAEMFGTEKPMFTSVPQAFDMRTKAEKETEKESLDRILDMLDMTMPTEENKKT
jgi:hypothetical protein